jgi:putative ATP-dependent endonuclease of OLD family
MKIKSLKIKNFRAFKGEQELDFDSNLIFLVGENNSGKSTVLESINYLINGAEKEKKYKSNSALDSEFVEVEAIIEDSFVDLEDDLKKYESYIFEEGGKKFLKIKRSSEEVEITQNKKQIKLDESKIQIFNSSTKQFENPTGKDTTFRSLLDTIFIWSDTRPFDVVDFGTTKILGKLVQKYSKDFFSSDKYKEFQAQHEKVFHSDEDSLQKKLSELSKGLTDIFNEQYGEALIQFNFGFVDSASYVKNGSLVVDENGNVDDLVNKGSGMQRSIALSVIQLFSNIGDVSSGNKLLFCIDEPELNLHPKAQEKLLEALIKISEKQQIFIASHSPYILKKFNKAFHKIFVCKKDLDNKIIPIENLGVIGWGPTLSEIDYFAYNISSKELFNDLFSFLEYDVVHNKKLKATVEKYFTETKNISQISYNKLNKDSNVSSENWTHLSCIRHKIHHQENTHNATLTQNEIDNGVQELIALITELN